jgi:galactokinase
MNAIAEKVLGSFKENFSSSPQLYFSPGRINLIGEHIDYNDGFVMPASINKGIYYAIAENHSNATRFFAVDYNDHLAVDINDIKRSEGWKNYVLGIVHEFLLTGKAVKGFDCVFAGDIPQGSGMSSSAAVEGGLAFAMNELFDFGLSRPELALLCQRAEHDFPGVKCGIMDMYASLNGRKDHVLMLDCKNITHRYFPLQMEGYKIVLINSKVHHSLAGSEYNVRRMCCEEGMAILRRGMNIASFRDINDVGEILPYKVKMRDEVYDCCSYVIEEIARTKKAAGLLQQDDLAGFGKLMYETHEGLSKQYKVSCAELDFLVDQARLDPAVMGSRQMGGGFGGCTISIVKEEAIKGFIEATTAAYKKRFNIAAEVYIVETADATGRIEG